MLAKTLQIYFIAKDIICDSGQNRGYNRKNFRVAKFCKK